MDRRKRITLIIVTLFLGLLVTGASYAFWSWNSNINKNVIFNTASNVKNYIVYDAGESKFVGDLDLNTPIHSTIAINKNNENISLTATIHMDINSIGTNMKNSPALKWKVTSGDENTFNNTAIASGNFIGANNGDVLTLVPNIPVELLINNNPTKYTIWIWLDSSEIVNNALTGETLDTNVWTEINQTEGMEDVFEITRINNNYQVIDATVVNNLYNITGYKVTTSNSIPTSWETINNKIYNLKYVAEEANDYYIWFKDDKHDPIYKKVTISSTQIDNTAPVCTFGQFSKTSIKNEEIATIDLNCTDSESGIATSDIKTTDLSLSSNVVTISNITKSNIVNGYKYTITVTGTSNDGNATLKLNAGVITDNVGKSNVETPLGARPSIEVLNGITCTAGTYLKANETNCTTCLAGSYCVGGTFNVSNSDQGISACKQGSYSASGASSCIACQPTGAVGSAGTTSADGATSCNASCAKSNVSEWNTTSWNANANTLTNLCSIKSCATGYTLSSNACTANQLTFNNQTLNEGTYGTAYTSNAFNSASGGTGSYTYTIKSGTPSGATIDSSTRKISLTNTTAAGTYNIVVTATDNNSGSSKDATMTIVITRAKTATTGACANPTYNGSAQNLASGGANVDYTNNSQTNVKTDGSYTVTVTPKANYAWSDGTYAAKTLNCNITKRTVTITAPTANSATLTYNNADQNLLATAGSCSAGGTMYWYSSNPTTSSTAPTFSTSSGWTTTAPTSTSYKGNAAGTYHMYYYCYVSDTNNNQGTGINTVSKIDKAIGKKATTLSLASIEGTLTYGTNETVNITTDGDGTLSCTSSDETVAQCSIANNVLTIIPQAKNTDGEQAIITVNQAAGTNYAAATSVTYTATVNRATLTCPQSPSDKTYDGTEKASGITCPTGSTAGGNQNATNASDSYAQTCTANNGYKFASECSVTWKIKKFTPTITLTPTTATATSITDTSFSAEINMISACSGTLTAASTSPTELGTSYSIAYDDGSFGFGQAAQYPFSGIHTINFEKPGTVTFNWSGSAYTDGNDITIDYDVTDTNNCNNASTVTYVAKVNMTNTVSFNANNGSGGQTADVTAKYGLAMPSISTTAPTRTGYTFAGWYDDASGGTQYYTAAGASAKSWDKDVDTTLYARWTGNTYTISFNANNGSGGQIDDVIATYGQAMPTISTTAPTRTGYTFAGWYDATSGGTQYYTAAGASARSWDKTTNTTLYAHWTDTADPTVTLPTIGNTLKATSQTVKLKCTDNVGVTAYYWGTTNPTSASQITTTTAADLTALNNGTLSKTVSTSAPGTYYLACKDAAGNFASTNVVYYNYKVYNVLETATGTEGTYTSANYATQSNNPITYIAKKGTTLTYTSIGTTPNYSSSGRLAGISVSAPSSTASSVSKTSPTLNTNNTNYTLWYNRNRVIFKHKPNGGTVTATTTNSSNSNNKYNWRVDSSTGYIQRRNSTDGGTTWGSWGDLTTLLRYGATSLDLSNYNNSHYLNITKSGKVGSSGKEWICESGCTTANKTFSQAAITINATDICSATTLKTSECTVVIKVNWVNSGL